MPSKIASEYKAKRARRDYLRHERLVLELQPTVAADLWRVGFAALEGASAYSAEIEAARAEAAKLRQGLGQPGLTAEQRAEIEASLTALAQANEQRKLQRWLADDRSRDAYVDRCDAHICAAVVRAGKLGDAYQPTGELVEIRDRLGCPDHADAEPTCPSCWTVELEPLTFVRTTREADYDADRVPVQDLGEVARMAIGSALVKLRAIEPAREVRPFRAGPAAGRDDG